MIRLAPIIAKSLCSEAPVVWSLKVIFSYLKIGPVSNPGSINIIQTPLSLSPSMIVLWIGAAPRQRGSSEACILRHPSFGIFKTAGGNISPYAATTKASKLKDDSVSWASGVFRETGVVTEIPWSSANLWIGVFCNFFPLPTGLGG